MPEVEARVGINGWLSSSSSPSLLPCALLSLLHTSSISPHRQARWINLRVIVSSVLQQQRHRSPAATAARARATRSTESATKRRPHLVALESEESGHVSVKILPFSFESLVSALSDSGSMMVDACPSAELGRGFGGPDLAFDGDGHWERKRASCCLPAWDIFLQLRVHEIPRQWQISCVARKTKSLGKLSGTGNPVESMA
ncbi:uncharacterized protein LOC130134575 isoform X1 [Syzygium oleosum]|uniref:uncharacterized protein LOC130134575 isoform X1 n=1 Tax=Syzygium oleosum TaxID=219896 RepID=UPI0024BAC008|nr:uncharacterized protein LOC130134575 isoform X1 [Syzygium oleosum]XP_056163126.1 uncharacterized protein LOC130134575 isoform X1 [Syzygium oleosum]